MAGHRRRRGIRASSFDPRQRRAPLSDHRDIPGVYSSPDGHRRRGACPQAVAFVSARRRSSARAGHGRDLFLELRGHSPRAAAAGPCSVWRRGEPRRLAGSAQSGRSCRWCSGSHRNSPFRKTSTRSLQWQRLPPSQVGRERPFRLGDLRRPGTPVRPLPGHQFDGRPARHSGIAGWKPLVWEISSVIVIFALIPFVVRFERAFSPGCPSTLAHRRCARSAAALVFSALHVAGMLALRKLAYAVVGQRYGFDSLPFRPSTSCKRISSPMS